MEEHIYTVDAIKCGDKLFISDDSLKTIFTLENIDLHKEPMSFKKLVFKLWASCLAHGSYPQNNPNAIKITTANATYYYDARKISKNQHWILLYLNQLHILDPHYLGDGTKWTILKQPIELLMSLGMAVAENIQKTDEITR